MSPDNVSNFNVWKKYLLKYRFSLIISGVGPEVPGLEQLPMVLMIVQGSRS